MLTIDAWAQQPNERFMQQPWLDTLLRWTGIDRVAPPVDMLLAAMDAAGVDRALLSAWHGPTGELISNDDVAALVARHPDRFAGLATVDLARPMEAVREIRRRADEGFVGVRVVPWLWNLPPNDRRYAPVYVACVEAGLPFCTQIGHTGPLCPSEPGRPIPYLDEVLSLATKYPNFHVDTSAYAVHRLPAALVEFMRGRGRTRVMFGTNWPMLSPERALAKLDDLGLDDEARALYLGGNAERVFFGAAQS